MEDIEEDIRRRLYTFFSNKGLSETDSDKIKIWNAKADIALEVIIELAREYPVIPASLKNLDQKKSQCWFDYVRTNFQN